MLPYVIRRKAKNMPKIKTIELRRNEYMEKWSKRAIVLLCGLSLWIFYFFQQELSKYGLYTIISCNVHEVASVIPFLCIGTAVIWCGCLLMKAVKKKKCDGQDKVFIGILLVIIFLLGYYVYQDASGVSVTVVSTVERVDMQKGEVVIRDSEGKKVTLESPELVNGMLETNGAEYLITYEWDGKTSELQWISLIE